MAKKAVDEAYSYSYCYKKLDVAIAKAVATVNRCSSRLSNSSNDLPLFWAISFNSMGKFFNFYQLINIAFILIFELRNKCLLMFNKVFFNKHLTLENDYASNLWKRKSSKNKLFCYCFFCKNRRSNSTMTEIQFSSVLDVFYLKELLK